jgi:hypothetical protein
MSNCFASRRVGEGYVILFCLIESLPLIIRVERRSVERWCDAKLKLYKCLYRNDGAGRKKEFVSRSWFFFWPPFFFCDSSVSCNIM